MKRFRPLWNRQFQLCCCKVYPAATAVTQKAYEKDRDQELHFVSLAVTRFIQLKPYCRQKKTWLHPTVLHSYQHWRWRCQISTSYHFTIFKPKNFPVCSFFRRHFSTYKSKKKQKKQTKKKHPVVSNNSLITVSAQGFPARHGFEMRWPMSSFSSFNHISCSSLWCNVCNFKGHSRPN